MGKKTFSPFIILLYIAICHKIYVANLASIVKFIQAKVDYFSSLHDGLIFPELIYRVFSFYIQAHNGYNNRADGYGGKK